MLSRVAVVAALLLACHTASHAQVGLLVNAVRAGVNVATLAASDRQFACKGPGSYQLASAEWQPAPLLLTNEFVQAGKGKEAKQFPLKDVRQVVVRTDTFVVMYNPRFPDGTTTAAPVLGRRVWRHPQVEQLEFHSASGILPMLRFPDGKVLVLPAKPKDFRAEMLKLVGDHPKLAAQLQTNELEPLYLRSILASYLQWKPAGFDTTAAFAAPAAPAAK